MKRVIPWAIVRVAGYWQRVSLARTLPDKCVEFLIAHCKRIADGESSEGAAALKVFAEKCGATCTGGSGD